MKTLHYIFMIFGFYLFIGLVANSKIYADGCYTCGSGSSENCKHYCRYSGSDTFENRKKCEKAGCKISGTASCPTAANYKVCTVLTEQSLLERLANYYKMDIK